MEVITSRWLWDVVHDNAENAFCRVALHDYKSGRGGRDECCMSLFCSTAARRWPMFHALNASSLST